MSKSLFERIGGEAAVKATVMKLYDKILDDESLAPFFEDISVESLRRSQAAFVTYAFGGPNNYSGRSLREAHKNAVSNGLAEEHFFAVAKYLKEAMQELDVPEDLIDEALSIVSTTKQDVLNQ